jgi:hypothetical protein
MSTIQEFLAKSTEVAVADLLTAFNLIPEDKRNWSAMGDARTVMDQMAEVAMLNGATADLMVSKKWPEQFSFEGYGKQKAELAQDWNRVKAMLDENTAKAVATIRSIPDSDLAIEVQMPWGPMSVERMIAYPAWNMNYHEAQINYIASMMGLLK